METNLKNIAWNPHTCACKLTLRKEETTQIGTKPELYQRGDVERLREQYGVKSNWVRLVVDAEDKLLVALPVFETVCSNVTKILYRHTHGLDEITLAPGIRIRAEVTTRCPLHTEWADVVQAQRLTCPQVCRCTWIELIGGEMKEGAMFGKRVEEVCFAHAEVPLAEIPALVATAANALPPPVKSGLRVDFIDGAAMLIYVDESGKEHSVSMMQMA